MTSPRFTCDVCGKEFDPDPEAMVESFMGIEGLEDGKTVEMDVQSREEAKAELGIDDTTLDRLLAGEVVEDGGACICVECQEWFTEKSS